MKLEWKGLARLLIVAAALFVFWSMDEFIERDDKCLLCSAEAVSASFWSSSGTTLRQEGLIRLTTTTSGGKSVAAYYEEIPDSLRYIVIEASGQLKDVGFSEKPWEGALIVVGQKTGLKFNNQIIFSGQGSRSFGPIKHKIKIEEGVKQIRISLKLYHVDGEFDVTQLRLIQMDKREDIEEYRRAALVVLILSFVAIVMPWAQVLYREGQLTTEALWFFLVVMISLVVPAKYKVFFSEALFVLFGFGSKGLNVDRLGVVPAEFVLRPFADSLGNVSFYVLLHFVFFLALTVALLFRVQENRVRLRVAFFIILAAILSESAQDLIETRTARITDIAVDAVGVLIGYMLCIAKAKSKSIKA